MTHVFWRPSELTGSQFRFSPKIRRYPYFLPSPISSHYIFEKSDGLFLPYGCNPCWETIRHDQVRGGGGGGGGGGTQVQSQRGAAPALRISRKKGSIFKTSACPRFCKRRVLFCTQVRSMGVKIPLQSTKYTRL